MSLCALVLASLANVVSARADWADDAWNEENANRFGHPAITLNAESGVIIVLPEATIERARGAGLSPREAAMTFLTKYGPEMCSRIIDLNEPRKELAVKLVIQRDQGLSDASGPTQNSVGDAIAQLEAETGKRRGEPERIFEVVPDGEAWTVEYAPSHRAKCVVPPEGNMINIKDTI